MSKCCKPSQIEVIDGLAQPPKPTLVSDLRTLEVFYFLQGFPPRPAYPRIFYMKLDSFQPHRYVQLTGPKKGEIWPNEPGDPDRLGPVERVKASLKIEREE